MVEGKYAIGDSDLVSGGMVAWERGAESDFVSAGNRAGVYVGSGAGAGGIHVGGCGSSREGGAGMPCAGVGSGSRSALGPHGGDVRRRPLPGFAAWWCGDSLIPRLGAVSGQVAWICHGETFFGGEAARSWGGFWS